MTQKTAAEALAAYDDLYKNPRTGEHIIDGDEAQVAADLAAVVREQQQAPEKRPLIDARTAAAWGLTPFEPTRTIESRRGDAAILVQLAGSPEMQLELIESIRADILEKISEPQQ